MCGLYTEDECIYLIAVDKLKINFNLEVTNTITHVSNASKLGKATFSIDFQLEEKDDDVIVHFPKQDTAFGKKIPMSHLEICITPDEISEGMTTIIDNYNSILQNQLEE